MDVLQGIERAAASATNRLELWAAAIDGLRCATVAEVGVFRGDFAQHVLTHCAAVERYYMIDPWRHLDHWNKPANIPNDEFAAIKREALARTEFAAAKRVVLQGKTTEVSHDLPNGSLDFAYIDGDHTLRGITIDLIQIARKIKSGGILAGDDFCASVWQHDARFEPTVVFPWAVYFAEAIGATIYGLPFDQFAILIDDSNDRGFHFHDLTSSYNSTTLGDALRRPPLMRTLLRRLPFMPHRSR